MQNQAKRRLSYIFLRLGATHNVCTQAWGECDQKLTCFSGVILLLQCVKKGGESNIWPI